jgi:hypothetical protein
LGKKTLVDVKIVFPNGSTVTASKVIYPIFVDLIIEADTYTPSFFNGRSLPIQESTLRAIALVHTGDTTNPESYSYRWSLDNDILSGGTLTGKYIISIPTRRFQTGYLSVEVYTNDGILIAQAAQNINVTQPKMLLYEHSPLLGLSQKASLSPLALVGQETTLYAEPFFMNIPNATTYIDYVWKLNRTVVKTDSTQPNAITLTRNGDGGEAIIDVSGATQAKLPQYIKNSLRVIFE